MDRLPPPSPSSSRPLAERRLSEMSTSSEDVPTSFKSNISSLSSRISTRSGSIFPGGLGLMGRRAIGLFCLMVTVCLWTVSNFLASSIFSDSTFNKPYFVVYCNSSVFAFSLVPITVRYILRNGGFGETGNLVRKAWEERYVRSSGDGVKAGGYEGLRAEEEQAFMADDRFSVDGDEEMDEEDGGRDSVDGLGAIGGGRDKNGRMERREETAEDPDAKLTLWETAKLSLEFSLLWVAANYFASACLEYTSVASSTILTSTSSIWTLIFCALLKIESFSIRKLLAVLGSLVGVILISSIDLSGKDNDDGRGDFPHKSQREIAIGDAMAFISALVYGVYVVVMKIRIGNESRVNMPVFFGLVGLFNMTLLWPVFVVLHVTGIETFELPPAAGIWGIIIFNSLASFVADLSWAFAMLLTTPLVVTVGLSLTIPLSLVGEMIQYGQYSSFLYWVGAVIVVLSFVFVNHESRDEQEPESKAMVDDEDDDLEDLPLAAPPQTSRGL